MLLGVRTLFETIAKSHPVIGHNPPMYDRFYGFSFDDSNSGDRDSLGFPRLGLASKNNRGGNGNYNLQGGSVGKNISFAILLLDVCADNEKGDRIYPQSRME